MYTKAEKKLIYNTMSAIFTCNFTDIPRIVFKHRFLTSWDKSRSGRKFRHCYSKRKPTSGDYQETHVNRILRDTEQYYGEVIVENRLRAGRRVVELRRRRMHRMKNNFADEEKSPQLLEKCIRLLQRECESSMIRVVKTIRMRMNHMVEMKELLPELTVVQGSRDPRGIINSRVHAGQRNISDYVTDCKILCTEIAEDLNFTRNTTIGTTHHAQFEDLALDPHNTVNELYTRLKLTMSHEVHVWIDKSTHASHGDGVMGTKRQNSAIIAYKWAVQLHPNLAQLLTDNCPSSVFLQPNDIQLNSVQKAQILQDKIAARQRNMKMRKLPINPDTPRDKLGDYTESHGLPNVIVMPQPELEQYMFNV